MNFFKDLFRKINGMTVYALVGPSGTGKSFRAKLLAQKYGIEVIIDDGLLIQQDKIKVLEDSENKYARVICMADGRG